MSLSEFSQRKTHICNGCCRGSALQRRLKEREKEMEIDERDRQREKEELEAIRRQLIEEGHPDPEAEMARVSLETILCMWEGEGSCISPIF